MRRQIHYPIEQFTTPCPIANFHGCLAYNRPNNFSVPHLAAYFEQKGENMLSKKINIITVSLLSFILIAVFAVFQQQAQEKSQQDLPTVVQKGQTTEQRARVQ
jgi:hypothetical protein